MKGEREKNTEIQVMYTLHAALYLIKNGFGQAKYAVSRAMKLKYAYNSCNSKINNRDITGYNTHTHFSRLECVHSAKCVLYDVKNDLIINIRVQK